MDERMISDCPACCGIRTVFLGLCSVCDAEFDEWRDRDDAADVPHRAVSPAPARGIRT